MTAVQRSPMEDPPGTCGLHRAGGTAGRAGASGCAAGAVLAVGNAALGTSAAELALVLCCTCGTEEESRPDAGGGTGGTARECARNGRAAQDPRGRRP